MAPKKVTSDSNDTKVNKNDKERNNYETWAISELSYLFRPIYHAKKAVEVIQHQITRKQNRIKSQVFEKYFMHVYLY